jgi:hypothetical protein
MHAKEHNWPFYLGYDNWHYSYKDGWHDYFSTLEDFKDPAAYTDVKKYSHADPSDMREYPLREYVESIKELFILKDELQQRVDDYIKNMGEDFYSLYVRTGDKALESSLIPLDDILSQTHIKDDGKTIFIQTDDYKVVKDMREKFPSCKIFTMTPEDKHGSNNQEMRGWTPEEKKKEAEELFISVGIFVRCKKGWTCYYSNVGVFHKLYNYDAIHVYTDAKYTNEDIAERFSLDRIANPYELIGMSTTA